VVGEVIKDIAIFKSRDVFDRGRGERAWRTCFESDKSCCRLRKFDKEVFPMVIHRYCRYSY